MVRIWRVVLLDLQESIRALQFRLPALFSDMELNGRVRTVACIGALGFRVWGSGLGLGFRVCFFLPTADTVEVLTRMSRLLGQPHNLNPLIPLKPLSLLPVRSSDS